MTADGVIPTLALVDELHRHKSADLYGIFRDGLGPRQGRMVTISTAGDDEDSPLGKLRQKAYDLPGMEVDGAYRHVRAEGFAMHEWALEANELPVWGPSGPPPEHIPVAKLANPAPWQTLEELGARACSPSMNEWQWARFACGVWGLGTERAFVPERWAVLGNFGQQIPEGEPVTLGFDGSRFHDDTGLIAADIRTGHLEVVGHWKRPAGADLDFEIPEEEVDEAVAYAFERWQVWRLYGDPPYWESALDRWAGAHGEKRVVRWWTNRIKQTALALRAFRNDMEPGKMSHDGDPELAQHVKNCAVRWTKMRDGDEFLWTVGKDGPRSPRKIDLAMAAMLAWEARGDAITAGDWEQPQYKRAAF